MNRITQKSWLVFLACAVTGAAVFHLFGNAARGYIPTQSLFVWWFHQLLNPASESEHGWLIFGLGAWLLWRNLREGAPGRPTVERVIVWPAAAAMAGGLALHGVGFVAQQTRISIVAFLLFTWGVLRLGGGPRWGRAAAFPLAFLVFAIPVNVLDSLGFWLRVWVVDASAAFARGVGIPVLRNGTQLLAPDGSYNYDVAAACSGVRSLTALAALSLLVGYLGFRNWGRRGLVFLSCLPLVYLGNVARIVAIILAAQAGGPRWGDVAHEVMGYGVFAIVLGGVLGVASLVGRFWPDSPSPAVPASAEAGRPTGCDSCVASESPAPRTGGLRGAWGVATGIAVLAAAEGVFLHHVAARPPGGASGVALAAGGVDPVELPAFLGTEWIGRRAEVSAVEREILPADTGFSRRNFVAVADARRQVFFSVVLSGRDRTSIHRPELCLVGQGWTIAGSEQTNLALPAGRPVLPPEVPVSLLHVKREFTGPRGRETVPQLVAYFFVGADGLVGGHAGMVWRDVWNRVRHGRADRWAYVLLQTDARDGEAAARARLGTVLGGVWPVLVSHRGQPLP